MEDTQSILHVHSMEEDTQSIKNLKKQQSEDRFVDDMVFEILTWLPAKSLMRFNCVSKAWNTLIRHDLNFVKLHSARSRAIRLLFQRSIPQNYSGCKSPTQLQVFPLQLVGRFKYFGHRQIFVCSNQCNGLVCLYDRKDSQGYLYNIATGEIKALPFSLGYKQWGHARLFLGYDLVTQRYKLIRDIITYKKRPCLKILTLGTNSWRRISGNRNRFYYLSLSRCAFLNGVMYWGNELQNMIIFFNFTEEKFGTLSLPQGCQVSEIQTALCGKLILHPLRQPRNYNWVYDEVNKVFTKFVSDPDLVEEKAVFLEQENILENPEFIFATSSLISTSTHLVFPDHFWCKHVSRFAENIIPLENLF